MDLKDLYRQLIMDHYKSPRNKGLVENKEYVSIPLDNPSCGDEIVVQILIRDNRLIDIRHEGKGCSICCSSSSIMSETLKNKSIREAQEISYEFYEFLKGSPYNENLLDGDVLAYQGIRNFPARIKCASLAWKALEKGIGGKSE